MDLGSIQLNNEKASKPFDGLEAFAFHSSEKIQFNRFVALGICLVVFEVLFVTLAWKVVAFTVYSVSYRHLLAIKIKVICQCN